MTQQINRILNRFYVPGMVGYELKKQLKIVQTIYILIKGGKTEQEIIEYFDSFIE